MSNLANTAGAETATIEYRIRCHLDYAGQGDKHPLFVINAVSKEAAVAKADWAVKQLFASGELSGAGLRSVEYEPEKQADSHWTKIIRDVSEFIR